MALRHCGAQVAEDEAVLERGVLVAAPVQTASPLLAAGYNGLVTEYASPGRDAPASRPARETDAV